jgi:hypothetical protein
LHAKPVDEGLEAARRPSIEQCGEHQFVGGTGCRRYLARWGGLAEAPEDYRSSSCGRGMSDTSSSALRMFRSLGLARVSRAVQGPRNPSRHCTLPLSKERCLCCAGRVTAIKKAGMSPAFHPDAACCECSMPSTQTIRAQYPAARRSRDRAPGRRPRRPPPPGCCTGSLRRLRERRTY